MAGEPTSRFARGLSCLVLVPLFIYEVLTTLLVWSNGQYKCTCVHFIKSEISNIWVGIWGGYSQNVWKIYFQNIYWKNWDRIWSTTPSSGKEVPRGQSKYMQLSSLGFHATNVIWLYTELWSRWILTVSPMFGILIILCYEMNHYLSP